MRRPRLFALTLAGLLSLDAGAASAAGKPECEKNSYSSPALQVTECRGSADLPRLAAELRRELGLSADVAAGLARVLAADRELDRREDRDEPSFPPAVQKVESAFIALLNRTPDDPVIGEEIGWFYHRWSWVRGLETPAPALLDLVARASDPTRLALRLSGKADSPAGAQILLAALAVHPEPAVLWHEAAQPLYDETWKTAFLEEAWRRLTAGGGGRPADPGVAAAIAEGWIGQLLDSGLAPQAIAAFQSLPPAVRSRIEQGSTGEVESEVSGLPFRGELRDLRLPLAAAYLLAGDRERAAGLIAGIPPAAAVKEKSEPENRDLVRRMLSRWLRPSPEDPFDLLTSYLVSASFQQPGTGLLAFARFAERERYTAVAAYLLEPLILVSTSESRFEPVRGVPSRVRAAAEGLRGETEKLAQSLADEARADRDAARSGFGPDPAAATVSRLLRSEPGIRFTERPLPAGLAPVELTQAESERRQKTMAAEIAPPPGFGILRLERQGDRAAAIGVSQAYDPVGELSGGAYWVLLSADGGKTWGPPLYTGLRLNQPYVARQASRLPLLADDHLRVEVEVAELDPQTITFPPIGLRARRKASGLWLDIPLDLLRKDADGDGLTDLAEERLLTDPRDRDTDGDGLEDAVDPLPSVPLSREAPSAPSRALAAFIADFWKVDQNAIVEGIPDRPRALCCARGTAGPADEKTSFLIAECGLFTALSPGKRLVVLTAEEADAATKKLGPFYPQRLQAFFFDRSGKRAYVVWSASWQGGQVRLEEIRDGTWKAETVSYWIT